MSTTITIDHSRCEANELCILAAPDTFRLDAEDALELVGSSALSDLAPDQQAAVEEAVASCPRHALSLRRKGQG